VKRHFRYWDSNCFLGWLKGEEDKKTACQGVIEEALKGEIFIVTSALTLAEVVRLKQKDGRPIPKKDAKKVDDFFHQPFIRVRNLNRYIAELARNLMWEHGALHHKDAIHVATAIKHGISMFDTFDDELIGLDVKLGNPRLRIGKPDVHHQEELFTQNDDEKAS
jgi:predicted nucleic acid-binding protein